MANEYYISAGITPIDNSTGATGNTYYIAAGLEVIDTAAGRTTKNTRSNPLGTAHGMVFVQIQGQGK